MNYHNISKNSVFNDDKVATGKSGNKLCTYWSFLYKDTYKPKDYLNPGDYDQKQITTNYRTSSQNLKKESGRYFNIPPDKRILKNL